MATLREMIDGTTIHAQAPVPIKPSPVVQQAQPKPQTSTATTVKGPKGKASPMADHISQHMQDPVGATKEGFQGLQQAKLQYDQQREEMQRNLAPVQSVINHVSQMHNLTPNQDQNMMPGQNGMNPDEAEAYDEDGNPVNMQQTVGKMNQSRPSMAGHQPGVAPGPQQSVVPPKLGVASPGAPGAGVPQPKGSGNPQFNKSAAPPKGSKQLPGAKGPGDPKVANKAKGAQTKSSRPGGVNVTVHAAATSFITRSATSHNLEASLGLGQLKALASGLGDKDIGPGTAESYNPVMRSKSAGKPKGSGEKPHRPGLPGPDGKNYKLRQPDIIKSGKMKKCDACGEMHAEGKCMKAGGPGSGRRPYKFGGEWHSKARGILKSHGFKNTGGGTEGWRHPSEKGPSRRLDSEYSKQVGNVTHYIRLNHDNGHWSHSTMTASPRGANYEHNRIASDRRGLGNLDSHLSSRIKAAGTSKGAKHRLSTRGQKHLSAKEKAAHWETMDAGGPGSGRRPGGGMGKKAEKYEKSNQYVKDMLERAKKIGLPSAVPGAAGRDRQGNVIPADKNTGRRL